MRPAEPNLQGYQPYKPGTVATCGGVKVSFDGSGSITSLVRDGRDWASAAHPIGRLQYVTNSDAEQRAYIARCAIPPCTTNCMGCGFIKCLSDLGGGRASTTVAAAQSLFVSADGCSFAFNVTFPVDLQVAHSR